MTGAGFVALGPSIGNLFTDSTALAGALRSASQTAGDTREHVPCTLYCALLIVMFMNI